MAPRTSSEIIEAAARARPEYLEPLFRDDTIFSLWLANVQPGQNVTIKVTASVKPASAGQG